MQRLIEPGSGKSLPLDEVLDVEDVLDAAVAWQDGLMATVDVAKIGTLLNNGHPSPGYTRFKALAKTPQADPRWHALDALCRHLSGMQGYVETRQGMFSGFEAAFANRQTEDLIARGVVWRGFKEKGS